MAKYFIYFFSILLAVSELCGLLFMGAIVALCVRFWQLNPNYSQDFLVNSNLHMFLSSLGSVFLTGNGIILFRVLRNYKTSVIKHIHTFVLGITLLITIWGFWCGIKEGLYKPEKLAGGTRYEIKVSSPDAYPLHGILGLTSLLLLIIQYIVGGVLYLLDVVSFELAEDLTGLHGFVGVACLFFNTITSLTGIAMKANNPDNFDVLLSHHRYVEANYENFTLEFKVLFAAAVFMTIFSWNFFYITVNPYFEWTMIEKY